MQFILWFFLGFVTLIRSQTISCPNHDDDCGRCSSTDDPHIITLDGLRYDQHTDGCFQYVTSCDGATDYLPFEVCGCHEQCAGTGDGTGERQCPNSIRCIRDLHLTFFDALSAAEYEISIDADAASNAAEDTSLGSLVSGTTYYFAVSNYFVYTQTGTVHEFEVFSGTSSFYANIRYSPGNLNIFLSEAYFTDLACGLCGKFNGDQSDDFTDADGDIILLPSDIPYGPISAANNTLINEFANTYLCNGAAIPADIPCEPTSDDHDCFEKAIGCCQDLWDAMGLTWDNDFVDEATFLANWLENCALDACAIAAWSATGELDCDNPGDAFSYAKAIADDTATAQYTVQPQEDEFASNCTAKICAHGDNEITLDVSYDGGSTWDLAVAFEDNWKKTLTATINPVDASTVLRFTVDDIHSYGVGGFLATVQLCGTNGYIFPFYTDEINTYFDVISDSAGDPLLDQFDAFGSGSWAAHVNEDKVECMNTNADWMWNDKTENTMVFEVFFGHHTDILQRLECVEEDTPAPTMDCCSVFTLDEYLDSCYCMSETPSPTISNTAATLGTAATAATGLTAQTVRSASVLKAGAASAASAGLHMIGDNEKNVFYNKMNEEMKEIKNMIYATWLMIFTCFVINIGVVNGCGCSKKEMQFKSVHDSDHEEECL